MVSSRKSSGFSKREVQVTNRSAELTTKPEPAREDKPPRYAFPFIRIRYRNFNVGVEDFQPLQAAAQGVLI